MLRCAACSMIKPCWHRLDGKAASKPCHPAPYRCGPTAATTARQVSPDDVRKAHAIHPVTAYQLEWSLWSRDAEVGWRLGGWGAGEGARERVRAGGRLSCGCLSCVQQSQSETRCGSPCQALASRAGGQLWLWWRKQCCCLPRWLQDEIVPLCRELGIGLVAYSPLGRQGGASRSHNCGRGCWCPLHGASASRHRPLV